ncbi:MAG: tyrosine-type recombinase/integrase [Coriobacteriia bacterium]|nr:tyrosine-type recombinase/integrase [Coriobacteriia bacterium]
MENLRFADGPYSDLLVRFVGYKRGKGEKGGRNLLNTLRKISVFLADETSEDGLDETTVRRILSPIDGESPSTREHRVSIVRQLCAFLNALGISCWTVPARYYTAPRSFFKPYIFSEEDVKLLLESADSLPPHPRSDGYEIVYPVLVRLLLSTGLRISEALALDVDDIGSDGIISVIHSKNGVSRLVPMSKSMDDRMCAYLRMIERDAGPLFLSPYTGKRYSYDGIHYMFERLYDRAGVKTSAGRRPRIHDLRHSFCTHSLDKMLSSGMDLYVAIPILAAYVGHVNLVDTEKYIHFTSVAHNSFTEAEGALASLIPKVVV